MLLKVLIMVVTINIMLYLGGFALFDNDIFDQVADVNEGTGQVIGFGGELSDSVPSDAQASTGLVSDVTGFSFFDALNIVWSFILFMLNIIFAPIGLLVGTGMPLAVQLMLGIPVAMAYIFGIIVLIRGGGA